MSSEVLSEIYLIRALRGRKIEVARIHISLTMLAGNTAREEILLGHSKLTEIKSAGQNAFPRNNNGIAPFEIPEILFVHVQSVIQASGQCNRVQCRAAVYLQLHHTFV